MKNVRQFFPLLFLTTLLAAACRQSMDMEIKIIQHHPLPGLPSASGIEICPEGIYVMGDDTPLLFRLDDNYQITETIRIDETPAAPTDGRIPKAHKPDFEAMASRDTPRGVEFFLFGSGSKSPERNKMVQVEAGPQRLVHAYDISGFYEEIRTQAGLKKSAFNLEAALIHAGMLYLFNRGENLIAYCPLADLLRYLQEGAPCPQPRISRILLPGLHGRQAGFSGATFLPGTASVLFTASVEHTDDWIADGEVAGSFIGLLNLSTVADDTMPLVCEPIRETDGRVLKTKVESVAVAAEISPQIYRLLLVVDNDDGNSELLEANLTITP